MKWAHLYARFTVGENEPVDIGIDIYWTGLQVYTVGGVEVIRQRSFWPNDTIEFMVGDTERHAIRVELKTFPPATRVYVDGEVYLDPLFPIMPFPKATPKTAPNPAQTATKARRWPAPGSKNFSPLEFVLSILITIVVTWGWFHGPWGKPGPLMSGISAMVAGVIAYLVVEGIRQWKARRYPEDDTDPDVD